MAKLTILAALLAALIAAASATTYTTVVTSVTTEGETCQEETQKVDTKACRAWFMQAGRGGGSISFREMGPGMCCSELAGVSEKCRCEAISIFMKEAQQKYGEMTGMEQMAESLPRMCQWESPTHCTMKKPQFY